MQEESNANSVSVALCAAYEEIRRIATWLLEAERNGNSFQPTALANEAIARVLGRSSLQDMSQSRVLALVAKTMRCVLIDHARRKTAHKRYADCSRRIPLDSLIADNMDWTDLLTVEGALHRLERHHSRSARVVELHFFSGLTFAEIANILGLSRKTVVQDWTFARAWLAAHLESEP